MRRILTGLLLFFPLLAAAQIRPAYGALEDSEAVAAMKEHVRRCCAREDGGSCPLALNLYDRYRRQEGPSTSTR